MVILGIYLQRFAEFLKSDQGKSWLDEAESKKKMFQAILSKDALEKLTDVDLRNVLTELDTIGSEEGGQLADTLVSVNGLENVKELIRYFLYGDDPLEDRYDHVVHIIPELSGPILMELAMYAAPKDFCLWDENTKETVRFIGQSRMHSLTEHAFSGQISGWDYVACKVAMNQIKEQVRPYLQRKVDFVDAYLFSRFIKERVLAEVRQSQS